MAMIRGTKLGDKVVLSNLKSMTDEQKIKMYKAYKSGYNHFELEAISKHIKEVSTIELEKLMKCKRLLVAYYQKIEKQYN